VGGGGEGGVSIGEVAAGRVSSTNRLGNTGQGSQWSGGTGRSVAGGYCRSRSSNSVRLRPKLIAWSWAGLFCAMQRFTEGVGEGSVGREGGSGIVGGARKTSC